MLKFALLLFFLVLTAYADPEPRTHQGKISLEARQFENDNDDETFENQRAIFVQYKTKKKSEKIFTVFSFAGRYDDQDPQRSLIWPEDVYAQFTLASKVSFSIGTQVFNHSYMEAFNPLDIVNARIIDVSIINADKLGELFLGFEINAWQGDLKLYFLPYATAPILPGKDSRLNLDKNFNQPKWIGQEGEENAFTDNFVITYEKALDSADILFMTSKSYDRTRLLIGTDDYSEFNGNVFPNTKNLYTPFYYERYMSGLSYVHNFETFQWKFATAYSYYLAEDEIYTVQGLQSPKDYTNLATGIEKNFEHENGYSSTLIMEVQKIFVESDDEENFLTQNDLFVAWRLSFNDVNSKTITLSSLYDLANTEHEGFVQMEYEQRLWASWNIEVGLVKYYIPGDSTITGIGLFEDKEHVFMNFSKFF